MGDLGILNSSNDLEVYYSCSSPKICREMGVIFITLYFRRNYCSKIMGYRNTSEVFDSKF